jgi:hypothetical protein
LVVALPSPMLLDTGSLAVSLEREACKYNVDPGSHRIGRIYRWNAFTLFILSTKMAARADSGRRHHRALTSAPG